MSRDRSRPLERYFSVLEMIAASQRGLSLTDIAALSGLPKPTVHRLVGALLEVGALRADADRQRLFRVGPRLWQLLHLGQDPRVVANYAQLVCEELAGRLHETCYIVRLGGENIRAVARAVPDQGHRLHVLPGEVLPPHAAASAKAILAFQPAAVLARLLPEPLPALTARTHTCREALLTELATVREAGFARCEREIDDNIMAYGCPVRLPGAGVIYSVGVTGPCTRLEQAPAEYWVAGLREATARFARMLATVAD